MKNYLNAVHHLLVMMTMVCVSCQSDSDADKHVLTVIPQQISFDAGGGKKTFKLTTDAPEWTLTAEDASWLTFSKSSGHETSATIEVAAAGTPATTPRTATAVVHVDGADDVQITISQAAALYPSYNTSPQEPNASGMGSDAKQLIARMQLGWNIGNALEATGGETAWGSAKITKELITLVKQSGFNAIRIPCSWNQYMENSTTARLKASWLNRVKEVIQYCIDNDMYVVLNIHWDGGWLENNCTPEKQNANNAKQRAFWEQIATEMRDFDEHLLFAGANEPNVENATQMAVLTSYHQTFIDAVRSTGGRNSYRVLVVQGPYTDIEKTNALMNTLPQDTQDNRLVVEVHYYTPYNFSLMSQDASWGNMFYYWGSGYHNDLDPQRNATYGEESTVNTDFALMKSKFIDKGIPVIVGEYGAMRRLDLSSADAINKHLASRAYYLKYLTRQAKANGIIPFYWDAGGTGNHGSSIFDRDAISVSDTQALQALQEGLE